MDIVAIKNALTPWMRVDTWHTTHPLDQQRFHRALRDCFLAAGQPVDFGAFETVMRELAGELHPNLTPDLVEEAIERYAGSAEEIASYLNDIGEL